MSEPKERWTLPDGYVLALVPALGVVCVHFYELGRFSFLGVPDQLIDLPVTRLIGGGIAISVFIALIIGFIQWSRRRLTNQTGFRRFLSIFATCFVLVGLPQLLQVSTTNGFAWSILLPASLALSIVSTPARVEAASDRTQRQEIPNAVGFLILAGLVAWSIFSMGFFSERFSVARMCLAGEPAFVVGFHGSQAIVKKYDPLTKRVAPGVELRETSPKTSISSCKLSVLGMPSLFDRAFNRKEKNRE